MKNTVSLKTKYEFKRLLYRGKYSSNSDIVIYIQKNKLNNKNALGICVSKKNGNSVNRNKLKRWAKESYKEIEKFLYKGYNIIVLYKKTVNIQNTSFIKVKEQLKQCFKKLKLYEEK